MTSVTRTSSRPSDDEPELIEDDLGSLIYFIQVHEDGPCPECPVELHIEELHR